MTKGQDRLSLIFKRSASRIGILLIRQPCQIVHAGIQSDGDPSALFEGEIAFAVFDFGIIALINAGQMLHFDLGIAFFFSQFF